MDFLDPKKKRAHRIRLIIGYGLMAIAIAIGTIILVLQAYGYDINHKNGKVIQNGLVFVDSHPDSSTVYINGASKGQTNQRLVLPAGQYNLQLQRTGYRTWQRTFNLEGGSIERFVYPFLFPQKLTPKNVQQYNEQPGLVTTSPDRHWLMVQAADQIEKLDLIDLNADPNVTTHLTLPAGLFTSKEGTNHLEAVEWSSDNRHVLLKHSFDGGFEFVVIDRQTPANSINLNRLFTVPMTKVTLHDKQPDKFYLLDSATGTLRAAEAKTKIITPVLEHVLDFHPDGPNQILYTTDDGFPDNPLVWAKLRDGTDTYNLRQIGRSSTYLLDMAKFEGIWYMNIGSSTDQKLYIYKDPESLVQKNNTKLPPAYRALRLDVDLQFVSFSANTQYIALQGGSKFAVYDLETNRQYRYDSELKLPADYKVTWMDGNRLNAVSEGQLVVFDYDNQNRQVLTPADNGYPPFFDRDYKVLYVLGPSATAASKQAITRSDLKLK